jgi:DNA-binding transcriptional LysR family regulator
MMYELSKSELRRLDLTVLLTFLALLRHRKAAEAALELGLTPSAISQALKRLRDVFGDPLFLRRPHGMEPTATALALEAPIGSAVETLRGALGAARAFDPAQAQGVVRIAALDAEQAVIIPPLVGLLRAKAPGMRLSVLPLAHRDLVEAMVDGTAELALGFLWELPETIMRRALYEESFLVAGRPVLADLASGTLSLDAYCAVDHILIAPRGDLRGIVDDRLEAMGRTRRVVLGLPAFLPALAAAAETDALVTLPACAARRFAPLFGLVLAQPPLALRRFPISVFWHRRHDGDARLRWLCQLIVESL